MNGPRSLFGVRRQPWKNGVNQVNFLGLQDYVHSQNVSQLCACLLALLPRVRTIRVPGPKLTRVACIQLGPSNGMIDTILMTVQQPQQWSSPSSASLGLLRCE